MAHERECPKDGPCCCEPLRERSKHIDEALAELEYEMKGPGNKAIVVKARTYAATA